MIRLSEAALLAYTKLRTRRIRTAITVVVSGLLFAGLIGALIVAAGTSKSIESFSQEGLNSRYIVATSVDQPNSAKAFSDAGTRTRAQQIYDQTVAAKKAEAKKLGIVYDPSTDQAPLITIPAMAGQPSSQQLNPTTPAAQRAIQEYADAHPDPGMPELRADAQKYHPTAFYTTTMSEPADGVLATMQNGQENFSSDSQSARDRQRDVLQSNGLAMIDDGLVKPFLLPGSSDKSDAIPVVVTYAQAQQLMGLTALPKSASAQQRLDRLKELYAKAGESTFSACYRNSVSSQQIQTAITQAQEIAKNKGNKDYQKPELIYGLPSADSCGQATVLSDTRTKSEKTADANQDIFDRMFGQTVDPVQRKFTFRIVGLQPDQNTGGNKTTMSDLLEDIVGSSLNTALTIPAGMLNKLPDSAGVKALLFPPGTSPFGFSPTSYFVEFSNAQDARNFINHKSCTTGPSGRCGTKAKPFGLTAYGTNSIAIQDLKHKFVHFFLLAALVVIAIALVIMGGTVGRMIADGRRETAVFRAIGAKRLDIADIYTVYTLCLSLYVALFALAAGLAAAFAFDHHFWKSTTVQAQLLFGASDSSRTFHFFALTPYIWLVVALAVACGFFSMILPLLRNIRRSPIRDMREE